MLFSSANTWVRSPGIASFLLVGVLFVCSCCMQSPEMSGWSPKIQVQFQSGMSIETLFYYHFMFCLCFSFCCISVSRQMKFYSTEILCSYNLAKTLWLSLLYIVFWELTFLVAWLTQHVTLNNTKSWGHGAETHGKVVNFSGYLVINNKFNEKLDLLLALTEKLEHHKILLNH